MAVRTVLGALTSLALTTLALTLALHVSFPPAGTAYGESFAALLADIAEIVLCVVSAWLAAATALSTLAATRGPASMTARIAARMTPRFWARVLGAVVGSSVCLGQVTAHAAYDESNSPGIVGLRLPDRPSGGAAVDVHPHTRIVRPGDTLWDIAAGELPPESTDADRADAWRRWYAENRSVIGADPDLLLPGTRLHPPSAHREGTS